MLLHEISCRRTKATSDIVAAGSIVLYNTTSGALNVAVTVEVVHE
jgi:hypothetical protein